MAGRPPIEDDAAAMYFAGREEGVRHFLIVPQDDAEQTRQQLIEFGLDQVTILDQEEDKDEGRVWISALDKSKKTVLQSGLDAFGSEPQQMSPRV